MAEINRKTLGLIGFGEIGMEVARRARGFDMEVLYYRRRPLPAVWEERLGVRRADLEELLETSDFVSLHAPHTPETEKLLNQERLTLMKPSAVLVNTSRGGLVDEDALARALSERRVAGAALDVFIEEPLPKDHAFNNLENVVLSPHTGGGSGGGQKLLIHQVLENVARFRTRGEALEFSGVNMSTLTVGSIRCAPGEKASGYIEAVSRVDGTSLGFPVVSR